MAKTRKRPVAAAIIGRALPAYNGPPANTTQTVDNSALIKAVEEINAEFAAFRAANDEHLKEVAKRFDDVVAREKVERINDRITVLDKDIGKLNAQLASVQTGAANSNVNPIRAEHGTAFGKFVRRGVDAGLRDLEIKAALSTDSSPDGGYTVPEELDRNITRVLTTDVAMRSLATVQPVGGLVFKKIHNVGGATSGWVGERESRTETNTPALREMSFPTFELYAMPGTTQQMLDDSFVNVESWLADEIGIQFAEAEGDAFINGNGVNKPRGFLQVPTIADASYAWGSLGFTVSGHASSFASSNPTDAFITLAYSLKRGYAANASWLMSRATQASVRKFKDGQGNYIWQPMATAGQPATLLGYPVNTDDYMPAVGANAFPVAFGDWRRGYLIVDRVGVRVLRDPYSSKPYVLFYTTKRVGGGVQDFAAIKLMKIST